MRCILATVMVRKIVMCAVHPDRMEFTIALIGAVKMADIFGIEKVWAAIYEGSRQYEDFGSKNK